MTPSVLRHAIALLAFGILTAAAIDEAHAQNRGRRLPLVPDGMVRLWNLNGSVTVIGWDRDSVVVIGGGAGATAGSGWPRVQCGGSGKAVKCAVEPQGAAEESVDAYDIQVRLPRSAQLWIKTNSGDVIVSGFGGDLDAYSVSGAMRVEADARSITLESMGGDIEVGGSAAVLRARTAGGGVKLNVSADDVTATTVSGRIEVTAGAVRRGRFESIEGGIVWTGPVAAGAALEFSNHGGDIELRIPAATAATFALSSYQGRIVSQLGGVRKADPSTPREFSFSTGGAGGARIGIRNFKGGIAILKRD